MNKPLKTKTLSQNSSGMVDVSDKKDTKRVAVAIGVIQLSPKGFKQLMSTGSPKGNVFETAKVAGVMAAKNTPQIIPLCHPLALSKVKITFEIDQDQSSVIVLAEVVCIGKTGVEMEALTAVTIACLTIYDMMKWVDQTMIIKDIQLVKKDGGSSGPFLSTPRYSS